MKKHTMLYVRVLHFACTHSFYFCCCAVGRGTGWEWQDDCLIYLPSNLFAYADLIRKMQMNCRRTIRRIQFECASHQTLAALQLNLLISLRLRPLYHNVLSGDGMRREWTAISYNRMP